MGLLNNIGISYKAGYLVQGNQIERCNTSNKLGALTTELQVRTDGKDFNIDSILKSYKGSLILHLPSINPDLSNLDIVNKIVRKLKNDKIKILTINASNLSLDLFEWSTLDEQKKYFLNIVTAIATIASNKIEIAVENLNPNASEKNFGSDINQLTDIIVYSRRLLVKDFGFNEIEAEEYIGISLDTSCIDTDSLSKYFDVFNNSIKVIKVKKLDNLELILNLSSDKDIPILLETVSDLDDIKNEYKNLQKNVISYLNNKGIPVIKKTPIKSDNNGFSNIIIFTMIVLTIVVIVLMFMVKLK